MLHNTRSDPGGTMALRIVILVLMALWLGSTGQAVPVTGSPVTWDSTGGDLLGWAPVGVLASVAAVEPGGNPAGYLQIQFDVGDPPGDTAQRDNVASSAGRYVGDYSSLAVTFDYFGTNSATQSLYFESADGSIWEHSFSPLSASWEHFSISFYDSDGWAPGNVGLSFEMARSSIVTLGFSLLTPAGTGIYTFGVDNLELSGEQIATPEPDAVILMMAVVLCLLVTFRLDRFISRSDWVKRLKMK
jgi:hypothetical protein